MKNQGVKKRREEWEEKFWTIILPHSKAIISKDSSVIVGSRRKDWGEFRVLERAPYFWIINFYKRSIINNFLLQ
jgi:hypothetical protein